MLCLEASIDGQIDGAIKILNRFNKTYVASIDGARLEHNHAHFAALFRLDVRGEGAAPLDLRPGDQIQADFDGYLGDVLVAGAFPPLHQDTATDDNPPCGNKKNAEIRRTQKEERRKEGKGVKR